MRLTAMALAEGCTKFTVSCAVVLKLCQLRERFWLDWLMVVVLPDWLMLPLPAVTCPPVGAASAAGTMRTSANAPAIRLHPEPDLPRPLAFSATAIHAFSTWLQMMR